MKLVVRQAGFGVWGCVGIWLGWLAACCVKEECGLLGMKTLRGIAVSPGVVVGRVFVLDDLRRPVASRLIGSDAVEGERARLSAAIEASLGELGDLRAHAEAELGSDAAQIFAFHQGILRDRTLVDPLHRRIEKGLEPAEYAVQEQFREVADRFAAMPDSAFQTKVDDVWDVHHRVLRHLIGEHVRDLSMQGEDTIVVANELTPTQAASFGDHGVIAFATESGGATSHSAIFARALGLAAVVGVETLMSMARPDDRMIVDGNEGLVVLRPDEGTLERYARAARHAARVRALVDEERDAEAVTADGEAIELHGNIEFAHEVPDVFGRGGSGVGLFRTEFLWLTGDHEPSEEEQYLAFSEAVRAAGGRPVTIRTFDLGADKYTQARAMYPERNPFLGQRSIRYCLANPRMFRRHLRAVLRATAEGDVRVMFPLVSATEELRAARLMLHEVMEDLAEEGVAYNAQVPVGMMVEVPSAAVMASTFAKEADFFSIGTNDLIQYVMAVDRTNERVAELYSGASPAVVRLMKDVVRAGRRAEIPVSCCGEMAGDPIYTMLLIGIGLRTLSASPSRLPYVKRVVRRVTVGQCERLSRRVGSLDSERQVSAFLRDQARKVFPELFSGWSDDEPA